MLCFLKNGLSCSRLVGDVFKPEGDGVSSVKEVPMTFYVEVLTPVYPEPAPSLEKKPELLKSVLPFLSLLDLIMLLSLFFPSGWLILFESAACVGSLSRMSDSLFGFRGNKEGILLFGPPLEQNDD